MPTVPTYTKCKELGCKEIRSKVNGYCIKHGGINTYTSDKRLISNAAYNTPLWRKIRTRQLSLQPLCQACISKGKVVEAREVDHVFAWNSLNKQAFSINLFQSLCQPCHSHKTALEQKGVYRYYGANATIDYSINDYHRVIAY